MSTVHCRPVSSTSASRRPTIARASRTSASCETFPLSRRATRLCDRPAASLKVRWLMPRRRRPARTASATSITNGISLSMPLTLPPGALRHETYRRDLWTAGETRRICGQRPPSRTPHNAGVVPGEGLFWTLCSESLSDSMHSVPSGPRCRLGFSTTPVDLVPGLCASAGRRAQPCPAWSGKGRSTWCGTGRGRLGRSGAVRLGVVG
jgi:hypothetical protein